MRIRTTIFGGYDKEDVYIKMNELVDMFRNHLKEEIDVQVGQKNAMESELLQQKKQVEEYRLQLQESSLQLQETRLKLQESYLELEELGKKLDLMTEQQIASELEMKSLKETYKNYCANILEQYSGSLHTLSTEFSKILENITLLQQNIVEMESIESYGAKMEEIEQKEAFEIPDLGIDIDEWLRGDEK